MKTRIPEPPSLEQYTNIQKYHNKINVHEIVDIGQVGAATLVMIHSCYFSCFNDLAFTHCFTSCFKPFFFGLFTFFSSLFLSASHSSSSCKQNFYSIHWTLIRLSYTSIQSKIKRPINCHVDNTFSIRSSTWLSLSISVPLTPVSIITFSIGRQCFSKLFGEKSTDDTRPSLPLVGVDAHELFGERLYPLISSNCLN